MPLTANISGLLGAAEPAQHHKDGRKQGAKINARHTAGQPHRP
jgi:hypothetical protein